MRSSSSVYDQYIDNCGDDLLIGEGCISFRSFSSGPAARARGLSPELWADVRSGPTRDDARWPSVPLPAARVSSVPESTQTTFTQSMSGYGST